MAGLGENAGCGFLVIPLAKVLATSFWSTYNISLSGWSKVASLGPYLAFSIPVGPAPLGIDLWPGPTLHPMPNVAGAGRGRGCCKI